MTTDNSGDSREYKDENVQVTYTQYETNGTTIHVADVRVSSAEYLKTAFAKGTYGKNVTQSTSEIAASNNAVLAVNGDYYGVQERGYVIRNGVLYREEAGENDVLCIYADGSMKVVDPSTATAQELLEQGVWQAFSFGPGLITDGEIDVALNTEVARQRQAIPGLRSGSSMTCTMFLWSPMDGRVRAKGSHFMNLLLSWNSSGCRQPTTWTAADPLPWFSRERS